MKNWLLLGALLLTFGVCASTQTQPPKKKKLLFIGEVKGFEHDSVSHAMATIEKLGQQSGLWDTFLRTDSELLTKQKLNNNAKNLDYFDAVMFYTTGELDLNDEQKAALLSFVKDDGKGFLGTHSATDTFYKWPEYGEMIGGYFNDHPWGQVHLKINVEDRAFPATKHFPASFPFYDEIYQFKEPYSREKLRVLMSVDPSSVDLSNPRVHRTDKDFAITWVHQYGKGRVFYSSLGHREEVWDRPDIQQMWTEGVKWAMGMTEGDATPRPLNPPTKKSARPA
jgi:type 1 glutamine amidotransferase